MLQDNNGKHRVSPKKIIVDSEYSFNFLLKFQSRRIQSERYKGNIMTATTAIKIVDELGLIQDQIDQLTEQAEALKNQLKMLGQGTYAGSMYVTTVKYTAEKKSTAWAAVAKELNAPADLVAKHTKITKDILSAETKALSN